MGWVLVVIAVIALIWYFNYSQSTTGLFESNLSVYFQAIQSGMNRDDAIDKMLSTRYPKEKDPTWDNNKGTVIQLSSEIIDSAMLFGSRGSPGTLEKAYVYAIFCNENGFPPTKRLEQKYIDQIEDAYQRLEKRFLGELNIGEVNKDGSPYGQGTMTSPDGKVLTDRREYGEYVSEGLEESDNIGRNQAMPNKKERTECPYCLEEVYAGAIKCKHCKSKLDSNLPGIAESYKKQKGNTSFVNKKIAIVLIIILVIGASFISWISSDTTEPLVEDPIDDTTEPSDEMLVDEIVATDLEVVVSSKEYTEQLILGQIAIHALEYYGIQAVDKTGLGGTLDVREAQVAGDIDIYWEYTGTALIEFMNHNMINDPEEVYATVAEWDEADNELIWLNKTTFNNTYAIMMRKPDAEAMGIKTISDLAVAISEGVEAPEPGVWSFASDHEYEARGALYAMEDHYGFEFENHGVMDLGITYHVLYEKKYAVAMGFATDARIAYFNLVSLTDDRHFHPVYNATPVIRQEILDVVPEIEDILKPIAHALDVETMSALNMKVDMYDNSPDKVAEEWLIGEGFIQ